MKALEGAPLSERLFFASMAMVQARAIVLVAGNYGLRARSRWRPEAGVAMLPCLRK